MGLFWGTALPSDANPENGPQASGGGLQGTVFSSHLAPNCFLSGSFRLHNRGSIASILGISSPAEQASLSDSELVLLLYRSRGVDCVLSLEGEFAFALWDGDRNRLFCGRDHMGVGRFYYAATPRAFHFASSPVEILRNCAGLERRLNRKKLAAMAIPRGHNFFDEQTFHEGILSLRPGSTLIADGRGIRTQVYWKPEIRPELVPQADDEAFSQLRELLLRAVGNSLRGAERPCVQLSGGLDSSAVTGIAAHLLQQSSQRLLALAAVLPEETRNRFSDERDWIEEFRAVPNLDIRFVTAAGRGPFDLIDDPGNYEHTFLRGVVFYLDDAMEDEARAAGADLALDGMGGEFGVTTFARGYALELLSTLRIAPAIRLLRECRAVTGVSPVRVLGRELLSQMFPLWGRRPLVYLTAEFQRECEARPIQPRFWPNHRREQMEMLASRFRTHAALDGLRQESPIRHASPLLDTRLIEFCLAAPGHMKIREGYTRYMIRRAMEGLIPERNRWRATKCEFSPDYIVRYAAQIQRARDFVRAIRPKDPVRTVVDVDKLLERVSLPEPPRVSWERKILVPTTIALICFLRQFEEFRP